MKEQTNAFKGNFHGILDHEGNIKVAGYDAENTVKSIEYDTGKITGVYCKGVGKKYFAKIHKNLLPNICYLEVEDTVFVKFRKGEAWITGFHKNHHADPEIVIEGDATLLDYFQEQEKTRVHVRGGGLK